MAFISFISWFMSNYYVGKIIAWSDCLMVGLLWVVMGKIDNQWDSKPTAHLMWLDSEGSLSVN